MQKRLCAIGVLVLAVPPFTEPFRTCGPTPLSASSLVDEDDRGSVVVPPTDQAGRLKNPLIVRLGLDSLLVRPPLMTFLGPSNAEPRHARVGTVLSTVLRI